jgi:hypothetical protein
MISAVSGLHRCVVSFAFSVGVATGLQNDPAQAADGVCHLKDFHEAAEEAQLRAEWFELWDGMNPVYAVKELKMYIHQLQYEFLLLDHEECMKWEKHSDNVYNLRRRLNRAYSVLRKLERPHQ